MTTEHKPEWSEVKEIVVGMLRSAREIERKRIIALVDQEIEREYPKSMSYLSLERIALEGLRKKIEDMPL